MPNAVFTINIEDVNTLVLYIGRVNVYVVVKVIGQIETSHRYSNRTSVQWRNTSKTLSTDAFSAAALTAATSYSADSL